MVAGFRRLIVLACAGALLSPAAGRAQSDADRDRAKSSVVMIKSVMPEGEAFGAGFVVASTAQDIYVATADHLFRKGPSRTKGVTVQFNQRQGQWFAAELLELRDTSLELAVIVVRLPPSITPAMVAATAAPSSLPRGTDVFPLGYPQQSAWDMPVQADKVARTEAVKLFFQSPFVREGNSGGPVLDACGRIVGMVTFYQPPNAEAVRIESILDAVARWSLPSRLTVQPASARCGAPASASAAVTPATPPAAVTRTSVDEVRRLHDREQWAESLPLLERLVVEQPAAAEVFALRAHAYAHLSRYPEAVADGERAVKLGPRVAEAYLRRGEAKSASGNLADALADYAASIKLNPKDHEAWGNQAWAYNGTGEYQKAVESATQALAIRSDRYDAWAVRGGAYLALNNPKAAINDLTQAITRRPGEADLFVGRSSGYLATEQYELGLNDANQALRLNPDYPDALVTRGAIYMALNRNDAARQDLSYALQLRPGMTEATGLLKTLDQRAGPANAAGPLAPAATPPAGATGGTSVAYGRLLDQTSAAFNNGRPAEASALIDQMLSLDSSRSEGWALRGAMFVGVNNLAAAHEAYVNALARGGTVYFRALHDHSGMVGCVGGLGLSAAGITFTGENGGHQLQWPLANITEIAINGLYGSLVGMFHLRARGSNDAFNFAIVHLNDVQLVNRRPESDLFISLVNQLRQASLR